MVKTIVAILSVLVLSSGCLLGDNDAKVWEGYTGAYSAWKIQDSIAEGDKASAIGNMEFECTNPDSSDCGAAKALSQVMRAQAIAQIKQGEFTLQAPTLTTDVTKEGIKEIKSIVNPLRDFLVIREVSGNPGDVKVHAAEGAQVKVEQTEIRSTVAARDGVEVDTSSEEDRNDESGQNNSVNTEENNNGGF